MLSKPPEPQFEGRCCQGAALAPYSNPRHTVCTEPGFGTWPGVSELQEPFLEADDSKYHAISVLRCQYSAIFERKNLANRLSTGHRHVVPASISAAIGLSVAMAAESYTVSWCPLPLRQPIFRCNLLSEMLFQNCDNFHISRGSFGW